MKTVYFLFGKEASEMLTAEGMESLKEALEEGDDLSFALYEFTPDTNPAEFLHSFKIWGEYSVITKEEFIELKECL
ncbi:hypothetical protein [Algoriphagus marinus]|uniref:hypothetical protein n=1 Tax=Algoriphagus marinus TaxID=1925762 RepID=UPI00094BB58F|nr:hypothetical protein [Algoriphagus marinus]